MLSWVHVPSGPDGSVWTSTQGLAVSHVLCTGATQVGPLQEQVRESVQAHARCEGAYEAVDTPQYDAEGPTETEQEHQPDDAPET